MNQPASTGNGTASSNSSRSGTKPYSDSAGSTSFEAYYSSEWERFSTHRDAQGALLALLEGKQVSRVLDVGCGAGQELLPFISKLGAVGAGIDLKPEAVRFATRKFAELGLSDRVTFHCGQAESLPFASHVFDLVICRLVLPYTLNQLALSEMARVLEPYGLLILRIHHLRYYLHTLRCALASGRGRVAGWSAKVILAGMLYHLTGHQPDNRIFKREVFQTRWLLGKILASVDLVILRSLDDLAPSPRAPIFLIQKQLTEAH